MSRTAPQPSDSLADVLTPTHTVCNTCSLVLFAALGVAALVHGLVSAAALVYALARPPDGPPGEVFFWALHVVADVSWVMLGQLVVHGAPTPTRRAWATVVASVSLAASCAIAAFWLRRVAYACTLVCMVWNSVYILLSLVTIVALQVPRLAVLLPYRQVTVSE